MKVAQDYARRAVKADASFADAHMALARAYLYGQDFLQAMAEAKKVLELNPKKIDGRNSDG